MFASLRAAGLALLIALGLAAAARAAPPLTVLISFDGFRADYLDLGVTPTLSNLAARGARAAMRPSFPTKTYPNHYALVTGLRPDRNGIVENTILDPTNPDATFTMSDNAAITDAHWWSQATPIWVTAERAGIHTAPMFWPGSEAEIMGVRPTHWLPFVMAMTPTQRTDQILAWLDEPAETRVRFATLYFDDVDTAGHHFGPGSPEVKAAAAKVDAAVARLTDGLKAMGIEANLIIVADHGMAATSPDRRIFYDDLFQPAAARVITAGAYLSLYPAAGHQAEVAAALLKPHAHMQCWRKQDIPPRYHYGANPRVPPLFCLPRTGWEITTHAFKGHDLGNHGFDPYSPQMAAVFIASGPAFRAGVTLRSFDNVDVYALLARLIGVKPVAGDGRLAHVAAALKP